MHRHLLRSIETTSALPPKAEIDRDGGNVRFVPKADVVVVPATVESGR
jgi:hypothetical protein